MTAFVRMVYDGLVSGRRNGADFEDQKRYLKTNVHSGKGFWKVVGVSKLALEMLRKNKLSTKGLQRDHMYPKADFVAEVLARPEISFEDFLALWDKHGQTILVTKAENPSTGAGYGVTYTEADIVWMKKGVDTHTKSVLTKKIVKSFGVV